MRQMEKNSQYETKNLEDIAEVINGKNINKEDLATSGIPYLKGRNLQQGNIVNVDTFVREDSVEKYAKQLLEEGDLLLQKNFGQHKIVKVTEADLPAIASNGLFIIRSFGVPESYLYKYLSSKTGKDIFEKQLRSIEKGSSVIFITLTDLKKLRVPIFDEQTMLNFAQADNIKIEKLIPALVNISHKGVLLKNSDIAGIVKGAGSLGTVFTLGMSDSILPKIKVQDTVPNGKAECIETLAEKQMREDFLDVGWDASDIKINVKLPLKFEENSQWDADIVLLDSGNILAVVEKMSDITDTYAYKLNKIVAIIKSGQVPFFIISIGQYYEIHSVNNAVVKKMLLPPKKGYLLSLLNEKEEK